MEADYCHDQKAHLVLKGFKAYMQQMEHNPQKRVMHGQMGKSLRPTILSLRKPRIDLNFNDTLWKNENGSPNDSVKNEIFKKVQNDLRNAEKEKQKTHEPCVCLREMRLIYCKYCGYHCKGRIQKNCELHPRVMFLMDIGQCPQCKVFDLKEYPLPEGY